MVSMATFSRIKAPIACAIILGAILGWSMANFPDYGRYFYNQTAPADYDKYTDQTGFPVGEGYKELSNRADIVEAEENYVVTVDVKDLKSANMYKSILKSDYYYGKFSKYNNANTEGGVGTFYVAKLKSGDEVIVLIDDRTFTIPKSGTVKLPVASTKEMESTGFIEKLQELTGLAEEDLDYYVDTTEAWRKSEEGQKIRERALTVCAVVFVGVAIICSFLFTYIEKLGAKNQEKNRNHDKYGNV